MAEHIGLPIPETTDLNEKNAQITRATLSIQAGYLTPEFSERMKTAFNELPLDDQKVLMRFTTEYYTLTYFSADLFRALKARVQPSDYQIDPLYLEKLWLNILVRGYRHIERDDRFLLFNEEMRTRGEVRIGFGDIKDFVTEDSGPLDRALQVPIVADLKENAYELRIINP